MVIHVMVECPYCCCVHSMNPLLTVVMGVVNKEGVSQGYTSTCTCIVSYVAMDTYFISVADLLAVDRRM